MFSQINNVPNNLLFLNKLDSVITNSNDSSEGGLMEQYRNYINFRYTRTTNKEGDMNVDPSLIFNIDNTNVNCPKIKIFNNCDHTASNTIASNWKNIGIDAPNLQSTGKVDCIWVDDVTTANADATDDIILIGTACSGMWKTVNSGTNWICITESLQLPSLGVEKIVVNPNNHNQIWISTGGFWNYSYGIFRSDDGGLTWCHQILPQTNDIWPNIEEALVVDLIGHPTIPAKLVAVTKRYLYTTTNSGDTWTAKARVPFQTIVHTPVTYIYPPNSTTTVTITAADHEAFLAKTSQFSDISMDVSDVANNCLYVSTKADYLSPFWQQQNVQCMLVKYCDIWNTTNFITPNDFEIKLSTDVPLPFTNLSTAATTNLYGINPLLNTTLQRRIVPKCHTNGDVFLNCGGQCTILHYTKSTAVWSSLIFMGAYANSNGTAPGYLRNNIVLDPDASGNVNHFYIGGPSLIEYQKNSSNVWINYSISGDDYINTHADINGTFIRNNKIYAGSDGGIFVGNTTFNNPNYTSKVGDLNIGITLGMGASNRTGNIINALMDNGSKLKYADGLWQHNIYGDGYGAEYEKNYNVSNNYHVIANFGINLLYNNATMLCNPSDGINKRVVFGGAILWGTAAGHLEAVNDNTHNPSTGVYFGNIGNSQDVYGYRSFRSEKLKKSNLLIRDITGGSTVYNGSWPANYITAYDVNDENSKRIFATRNDLHTAQIPGSVPPILFVDAYYSLFKSNAAGILPVTGTALKRFWFWPTSVVTDNNTSGATERIWVGMGDVLKTHDNLGNVVLTEVNKKRVYYSEDGAATFTDVSNGLPPYPINKLVYDHKRSYLFAGTDIGVYVLDTKVSIALQKWECFNTNLPYTIINDMEISECADRLIVGTLGRGTWETELPFNGDANEPNSGANTVIIPTGATVVWNTSRNINKTIIVNPGAQLIIEGTAANPITINFATRTGIEVRSNASLVVRYATLTNECGKMWSGISVAGATTLQHCAMPTIANPTNAQAMCATHGVAWLYQSTISNAQDALFNYQPIYIIPDPFPVLAWLSGGILIAHNTKFINNKRSVDLQRYGGNDESRFIDCEFIADKYLNDYPAETPVNLFVYAYDVKDIEFRNCKFNNIQSATHTTKVQYWPTAIYGFDAGLKIENNEFNKMCYGLWLDYPLGAWNLPIIRDNTLNEVYRGMYVTGCTQPHIVYNNTIHLTYCADCTDPCNPGINNRAVGMYLDNTTSQFVMENKIDYNTVDYNNHPNDESWGIILQNINGNSNKQIEARRNVVTNLYYGMTFLGRDKNVYPQCNYFDNPIPPPVGKHFTNFYAALSVNEWCDDNLGTVLPDIMGGCGDFYKAMKNRFSDCVFALDRFYTHPTVNPITYYSVWNPPFRSNLCMTSTLVNNGICDIPCYDFEDCCTFLNYPYKDTLSKASHLAAFATLHTSKVVKENMIDDDNTAMLLGIIANTSNSAAVVNAALVDVGAYLSDAVLLATINRGINPLSNYDLKNRMIANSPLAENVFTALDAIRPVVANNYLVWNAQQNAESPRQILEQEINGIENDIANETQTIVDKYIQENNKDAAINFLLLNNEARMAFPIMLQKGDYTNAQLLVNALPNAADRAIATFVVNHKSVNIPLTIISTIDSTLLDSIANSDNSAAVYAQSLLKLAFNKQFNKKLPSGNVAASARMKQRIINYSEIVPEQLLYIYPNPTKDVLHIVNYDKSISSTTIQITDVLGKIVYEQTTNAYVQETNVATCNFAAGTYAIKIFDHLKNLKLNEKFIVIK